MGEEREEVGFSRRWEAGEIGKIMQHCIIFHNKKKGKGTKMGREPGLKGMGSGTFKLPPPHPTPLMKMVGTQCNNLLFSAHAIGEFLIQKDSNSD